MASRHKRKNMKNLLSSILVLTFLLFRFQATADAIKSTKAQVNKAIVYLSGAQLSCASDFSAVPGINQFIFEGVSPSLDKQSIQASAKGNVVIMDVKYETRYNEKTKKEDSNIYASAIKAANDSLVLLSYEIDGLNEQLNGLTTEKNILLNNRLIKGESLRDTLDMFKAGIEFLRQRLANISNESAVLKRKLYFKNESKSTLQKRIDELNEISNIGEKPVQESIQTIVVSVYAEVATTAEVTISFFVQQAAWLPAYDLRASANGTIDLAYKAELRQQSGMDWKNVSLTLSTGNPTQSTLKPELNPFYLSFIESRKKQLLNEIREMQPQSLTKQLDEESSYKDIVSDAYNLATYTTETEKMMLTEYEIKLKYSIPNDPNNHVVSIQHKNLESKYKYSAVPKMDLNAYLLADIHNWGEINLLPGSSRIYFDGNYIGTSVLNPDAAVDTLSLSLGKDRSILVSRKKLKDKTKERVIIDEKSISVTYEIAIRNTKSSPVQLDVTDQIPLSQNPDIKIALLDGDGATLNPETGMLVWNLNLKANDSKKLKFTYEVKIPKNKNLAGL